MAFNRTYIQVTLVLVTRVSPEWSVYCKEIYSLHSYGRYIILRSLQKEAAAAERVSRVPRALQQWLLGSLLWFLTQSKSNLRKDLENYNKHMLLNILFIGLLVKTETS